MQQSGTKPRKAKAEFLEELHKLMGSWVAWIV